MSIISRMRKQDAVYWPRTGTDRFGKPVLGEPIAVKCRWEEKGVLYNFGKAGEQAVSNAEIYVDQELDEGGYIWKGLLENAPESPLETKNVYEVRKFNELPNLRNTEVLYTVFV
jgi:hypothetical protein